MLDDAAVNDLLMGHSKGTLPSKLEEVQRPQTELRTLAVAEAFGPWTPRAFPKFYLVLRLTQTASLGTC